MTNKYNSDKSNVVVTFKDGGTKVYTISAGPAIGSYLARSSGESGVLSLWNNNQSWGIPITSIRDWEIRPIELEEPKPLRTRKTNKKEKK